MRKIVFFVQHMLCGGVENALISLSKELYKEGNDVTIYVVVEDGDMMKRIPEGVKQKKIPMPETIAANLSIGGTKLAVRKNLKEHHYLRAAYNLKKHILGKSGFSELNIDFTKIPILEEEFDIAVNFHMHSPFLVRYLSEKVKAIRKLSWIHNDFTTTGYKIKKLQQYLGCCTGFYAVSKRIFEEFTAIFPEYKERTEVIYNIVPVEEILKKAQETAPEYETVPEGYLKLLSVGRLEEQKGYDLTISVCKKLVDAGYKFKWFILGEGSQRANLEKMIHKQRLDDVLFLLGIRLNPYPYFKNCDIYVQTSRHEGYVTTVTEAKIFNRPNICTDVSGAKEQIQDGINGYVTDFDVSGIAEKVARLFNQQLRDALSSQKQLQMSSLQENLKIFKD